MRHVRYVAKGKHPGLFVARSGGKLAAFGIGPRTDLHVKLSPSSRKLPSVRRGRDLIEKENVQKVKRGEKPLDLSEWGSNRKVGIKSIKRSGRKVEVIGEARGFGDYVAGIEEGKTLSHAERRAILRSGLKKGKTPMIDRNPHVLNANVILLIGNKWLLVPKRSKRARFYAGEYHPFAGMSEDAKTSFKSGKTFSTKRDAKREVAEEAGIPSSQIEFVGPSLRPSKLASPFVMYQKFEPEQPGVDFAYLAKIKGKNSQQILNKYFIKLENGDYIPRRGVDRWEHRGIELVELSSRSVGRFMKQNSERITPMALIMLKALEVELKRLGK